MELIFLIIGIVIGAVAAWLIRKYMSERDMVSVKELDAKQSALLQAENTIKYLQEKQNDLQASVAQAMQELRSAQTEKEQVQIQLATSNTSLQQLSQQLTDTKNQAEQFANEINELKNFMIKVRGENEVLKEKNATIKKEIEELGEKSTMHFRNLANEILEDKSKRFTEENQKNIKLILDPLNQDIRDFKKKVEDTYEKENKQRFSLEEKIRDLVSLNQRISDEANNLTKALKGQRKTQGDWGEMILENILQQSGLTEGREYAKQTTLRDESGNTLINEDGRRMQPDFIIYYPDKREVIIDSKVSLSAYERFSSADDDEAQKKALDEHVAAVYHHIDELSKRSYQDFAQSLDFVMMFVPIEPAYLVAMQHDRDLWNYAYKKRILLISPTNLIAAVKLVSEIWKKDEQNKNAIKIAERGAALYDKFVGFVENLQTIGDHIARSQRSYDDAMKQLKDGSGNLIGQAEKLRKLGVSAKKTLPGTIIDESDVDDDQ
ncbi:MAG TPA: DNA recombination protein RmuC [Chitinophagales bacterium]|nr:DNA recombination protein RmuC [Chitinophagales bacterium]HNF68949.1 DNA recombination protein RmuC [Chitinophagales bacterium]HNI54726.1 DNA recombination protein RmuC [Chitinophagales bacterium]HNO28338.1 DNA recombination protein RmuC [Chitinophagales bacterium]